MITAQPRLYYNTKLTPGNVLDYTSRLNSATHRDFQDHVFIQDLNLPKIKLKATWNDVKNADYCKINNTYFNIVYRKMLNENCAELTLEIDGLMTLGGALNVNYEGGIIKRAHALTDDFNKNTTQEEIGCSQILRAVRTSVLNDTPSSLTVHKIIASTVDLSDTDPDLLNPEKIRSSYVFNTQIGTGQQSRSYTVVVPKTPAPAQKTLITGVNGSTYTSGYGLYDADNTVVKNNLTYIRALGLSDAILFSYELPAYASTFTTSDGHVTALGGGGTTNVLQKNISDDISFTPENQKTISTHNSFVVKSQLSGDMKEYNSITISNPTGVIDFVSFFDPQYQGRSYCAPYQIYGDSGVSTQISNSVKGAPWKDIPICFSGSSGSLWTYNDMAMAKGDISRTPINKEEIGIGIFSNVAGLLETIREEIHGEQGKQNLEKRKLKLKEAEVAFRQSRVVAPELTCSPAIGLQNLAPNGFDIIHLLPTDSDLQAIDKYYTLYGYAQPNITFDKSYMQGRQHYNYIEVSGIHIIDTNNDFGIDVIEAAIAQLQGGCKIWHELPQANITSNPIV